MIDRAWAVRFAAEWIDAWNTHDLERILSHYTDDFEMHSPLIVERMGVADGMLKGKAAVRSYWQKGLAASPPLHFELRDVLVGADTVVIYYRNTTRSRMVAEVLIFNLQGKVVRGAATYGNLPAA